MGGVLASPAGGSLPATTPRGCRRLTADRTGSPVDHDYDYCYYYYDYCYYYYDYAHGYMHMLASTCMHMHMSRPCRRLPRLFVPMRG